jgi:hypothetical protein
VPKRSLSADDQPVSTTPEVLDFVSSPPSECILISPVMEATAATSSSSSASVASAGENDSDHAPTKVIDDRFFDVIVSVSHSHTVHCDLTEDKVAAMSKRSSTLACILFVFL